MGASMAVRASHPIKFDGWARDKGYPHICNKTCITRHRVTLPDPTTALFTVPQHLRRMDTPKYVSSFALLF